MERKEYLISHFGMEMLSGEGTYVKQVYAGGTDSAGVPAVTCMYGLYSDDPPSLSLFHRLTVDEVWSWYEGDPLELFLLKPDGTTAYEVLGPDTVSGQRYQFTIPAGTWQAGRLLPGGTYCLYGCTCVPGFTPECFTAGDRNVLIADYPESEELITMFTCDLPDATI